MAVVANDARDVLLSVLRRGKPIYGHLGVHVAIPAVYGHLSAFARDLNYPIEVDSVTPGSAAEKAGLQRGDIITEFGGKTIENFKTFKRLVGQKLAGEEVSIGIVRDGEPRLLKATMAELDSHELFARWEGWTEQRAVDYIRRSIGAEVSNLSAAKKSELGLPAAAGGVVVMDVLPRMPAHGVLRRGDLIEICNGRTFQNAKQFVALLDQRPQPEIDLLITRELPGGGRTSEVLGLVPFPRELEEEDPPEKTSDPA
jgi:serine protease Do